MIQNCGNHQSGKPKIISLKLMANQPPRAHACFSIIYLYDANAHKRCAHVHARQQQLIRRDRSRGSPLVKTFACDHEFRIEMRLLYYHHQHHQHHYYNHIYVCAAGRIDHWNQIHIRFHGIHRERTERERERERERELAVTSKAL